jgi:hypothetical protein
MDGGPELRAGSRRMRVLLVVGAAVVLALAIGVGVVLGAGGSEGAGKGGGNKAAGSGLGGTTPTDGAGQGTVRTGGQVTPGGGAGGGGSSPTTTRPATTTSPTTTDTTSTTQPHLQITHTAVRVSSTCTQAPAGYYNYTAHFFVEIDTAGVGILVFEWGRGTSDTLSPPIERDIPPERQGAMFEETDVISGRAPSATTTVVDRLHFVNPPPAAEGLTRTVILTHSVC